MCKVFKPSASRCPHKKDVCRNRALHPRHDVVYLKNPEVQLFNGCGYCKWAKLNPPPKGGYLFNPGWPGCCRPPSPSEYRLIGAADWPAVSIIHHIPIPPDVKSVLESLNIPLPTRVASTPGSAYSGSTPSGSLRGNPNAPAPPVRRQSYNVVSAAKGESISPRSPPLAIPIRGKSGSPQQLPTSLHNSSRDDTGDTTSSSLPNSSILDDMFKNRRAEKRPDVGESKHSPGRKHAELSGSISRKGIGAGAAITRRPSLSAATPSMSVSKVTVDAQPRRRDSPKVVSTQSPKQASPPSSTRSSDSSGQDNKDHKKESKDLSTPSRKSLENAMSAINISSASSDSSGGSSETTVISDGGFTDYLSDESEAELQRQAELKAALLAQNLMEEQEFRAARQQLAHVDLRPPRSWTGNVNSTPRSQAPATQNHNHNYNQTPSYPAAYSITSPSRG
ncbi:hypothetical protein K474DRAFT_1655376 [Panus rudis PR-1116 ss-1]|nr:hypothetical protein K474DRAFT_1655376 [Panus rudis PR-1116 ss-1]